MRVAAADYEDKMKAYKKATNAGLGAVEKPPVGSVVAFVLKRILASDCLGGIACIW